jgi:drug/metabolite transporter (DMT)-like permease
MSRQPLPTETTASHPAPHERLRGIAFMVSAVAVFSVMDSLLKRLSDHYPPLQISCLRSMSSWLLLLAPIAWRRSWSLVRLRNLPLHAFRGLLGVAMLGSFVYAVHRLSLAQTYSLFLAAPLLMTTLSVPIHGEKVPPKRWLVIAVGLSGVLVILHPWGGSNGYSLLAALAAAAATISYSLSALTVRTLGRNNSSMSMVFWYLAFVSVGSGALAAPDWHPIPLRDWGWLVGVGVTGALGQVWLTEAFHRAPPSVVAPFEYTSILWAFAIDWIFWSASPSPSLVAGAAIVIACGIVIILDERRLNQLALEAASPPP